MPQPIAFVSRLSPQEEAEWIAVLSGAMPQERVVSIHHLAEHERGAIEIAIVANPDPVDLAKLDGLVWIHSLWAGVERLVAELGEAAPPIVRLVDPELSRVMAEAVLAWTFYLQRDMPAYRAQQSAQIWAQRRYRPPSSFTVGVLGLGELGRAAASALLAAGFQVAGWSASEKSLEGVRTYCGEGGLAAMLSQTDIAVCLLPLTGNTRGLLGKPMLSLMPKGASVINFARGAIVNSADLISLLDDGHLDHAVLDVFEQEPLPPSSLFWSHSKITVLPHISAPTSPQTSAALVARNIRQWRTSGELPKTVNMQRGY